MKEFLISKKGIFCINLVLLILFAFSGCMKYEVSDDFIMEMVVSGAYTGSPSSFLLRTPRQHTQTYSPLRLSA